MKALSLLAGIAMLMGTSAATIAENVPGSALRQFRESDEAEWRAIYGAQLAPNGDWFAYAVGAAAPSTLAEAQVVVRSMARGSDRRYSAGALSSNEISLKVSPSGAAIAFQAAPERQTRVGERRLNVAVVNPRSGLRTDIEDVQAFEFIGRDERLLARGYPTSDDGSFVLTLHRLDGTVDRSLQDVRNFTLSPSRERLVCVTAQSVELYEISSGRTQVLDRAPANAFKTFTWSKQGNALAMLRAGPAGDALVVISRLNTRQPKTQIFELGSPQDGAPTALVPRIEWREDGEGLYVAQKLVPARRSNVATVPNLALWHWRDEKIPAEKERNADDRVAGWYYLDLKQNRFTELTAPGVTNVELQGRGNVVLAYDAEGYGWQNSSRGGEGYSAPQLRNYYSIDIHSGRRVSLIRGLKVLSRVGLGLDPQLSPDGTIFLYQNNNGDVVAHTIQTGASRNLTAALPTKFYLPENDPKIGRAPRDPGAQGLLRVQGWTRDGSYVLVSDYYDVWALPLRKGKAQNLTAESGRERHRYYFRKMVLTEPFFSRSQAAFDLSEPMYFQLFDLQNGETGLARWRPQRGLEVLHSEYADTQYVRARKADVFVMMRTTAVEPSDFFLVDSQWRPAERLTDSNPQRRSFTWPPPSKYLTYRTAHGDTRHAVLHMPAGYVEGRSYPTVVEIYTTVSPSVHVFREFGPMSVSRFVQHGYAYLMPDIVPRIDDSGQAALDDVNAALGAAIGTGVVDRDRVGLHGYSYGAYETNFIVTHTDRFKAALAMAGMVNLWSDYGGIYAGRWPKMLISERSQPFLSAPWWERPDAFARNSPITKLQDLKTPLLLVHGTEDKHVPFSQSIEMFNSLRRVGGKPVVLLEYRNNGHVFDEDAMKDIYQRALQFFDHFLKDTAAPAWWADGLSMPQGSVASEEP